MFFLLLFFYIVFTGKVWKPRTILKVQSILLIFFHYSQVYSYFFLFPSCVFLSHALQEKDIIGEIFDLPFELEALVL